MEGSGGTAKKGRGRDAGTSFAVEAVCLCVHMHIKAKGAPYGQTARSIFATFLGTESGNLFLLGNSTTILAPMNRHRWLS